MLLSEKVVNGVTLGSLQEKPVLDVSKTNILVNAEGMVLLKNNGMLPLVKGDRVSVFGRMQREYYNSGCGSGGMVNVLYKTNIFDSLAENKDIYLNEELAAIYKDWVEKTPHYNVGAWGVSDKWSQPEMPLSSEMVERAAQITDKAIVIIARMAGEELDNKPIAGSYMLSETEMDMIKKVSAAFKNVCVLLNTGNVIDMKWAEEFNISAVMYVWQGGQDGGKAVADVLCGKQYPSGKLVDTIVKDIEDYPSYKGFFEDEIVYTEDIYVGYRYFETFCKDKVLYPFGYGIGYTTFETEFEKAECQSDIIKIKAKVRNTGNFLGKEILQVYYSGAGENRPIKELAAFKKTKELAPGETEEMELSFSIFDMSAYDEEKSAFILEKGEYNIYFGTDVRSAEKVYAYDVEYMVVTKKCMPLFNPNHEFERIVNNNGKVSYETVKADKKTYEKENLKEIPYTGNKGIKLKDVYDGKKSLEEFVAQLGDFELACLTQGEGMNSPKVRPGTGGALGGITNDLQNYGIPPVCVTDGPSGIRMDNGDNATSYASGTMIACTWNYDLIEKLFSYEGMEIFAYKIDALLGPGINIHRIPLCGRNFEYLSEDPYLAGTMAKAICAGLDKCGVTATIKHFAANNRETGRNRSNSLVSERALREIYLKPFEMVIKDGKTRMLMTSYNRINGIYAVSNYDLVTGILRKEWGYTGLVMSDWWPFTAVENGDVTTSRKYPIKAQNDLYMVNKDAETSAGEIVESLNCGEICRAELQQCALNICKIVMTTPSFERYINGEVIGKAVDISNKKMSDEFRNISNDKEYDVHCDEPCEYAFEFHYSSAKSELVQIPVKVFVDGQSAGCVVVNGSQNKDKTDIIAIYLMKGESKISFSFDDSAIKINAVKLYK